MTHKEKAVAVDDITLDDRCQTRVALDQETVDTYADLYRDDVKLPALDVWEVDGVPYLVDGFHRLAALRSIGKGFARVRILGGSNEIEDATLAALKTNHEHGLRRSRADKRRAVRMALEAGLYEDLGSERALAKDLAVSHPFIAKVRAEWEAEQSGNVTTDPDLEADGTDTDDGGADIRTEDDEPSDNEAQPEPKKAKPSPFEAFRKNVEHVERDVPNFFEPGTEVHEVALRLVVLVREHEAEGVAEVA